MFLLLTLRTYLTPFSSVFIGDFEQANVSLEDNGAKTIDDPLLSLLSTLNT